MLIASPSPGLSSLTFVNHCNSRAQFYLAQTQECHQDMHLGCPNTRTRYGKILILGVVGLLGTIVSENFSQNMCPQGVCGLPENRDTTRTLTIKLKRLTELIRESHHTVVLTGAGISTSAGIPDFRGPHGIWTAEKKKQPPEKKRKVLLNTTPPPPPITMQDDFSKAQPTTTHRAIVKLVQLGKIQYCITQNVDGLHRRSGLSRQHHSVLHGCVFTELCEDCKTEHFRDYDVGGMSFQQTGRTCEVCRGCLRDVLLDWDDELPEEDLQRATDHCLKADLVVCLGTSLRIEPAGSLPTLARKFVIVNLQETPYDKQATLIVRAPVDEVMNEVMTQLGYPEWDDEEGDANVERLWKPQAESKTESTTDSMTESKK